MLFTHLQDPLTIEALILYVGRLSFSNLGNAFLTMNQKMAKDTLRCSIRALNFSDRKLKMLCLP